MGKLILSDGRSLSRNREGWLAWWFGLYAPNDKELERTWKARHEKQDGDCGGGTLSWTVSGVKPNDIFMPSGEIVNM